MANTERVAIVTGAARPWGLGRCTALGLATKGLDIAVVDFRDDWGTDAVSTIKEKHGRNMIRFMVSAPESWKLPVVGANEMLGCVLFHALRGKGVELFADEPAVSERIKLLYNEILGDEISHVGFEAARLSDRGRSVMRSLFSRMAPRLASHSSEVAALFGREEMVHRLAAFDFVREAPAELPAGLAFAAAPI